jgi:Uma2 family endonuclease
MNTPLGTLKPAQLVITWEALPQDLPLDSNPGDDEAHPLLAGALREGLELCGFIQPKMLVVSNFGLCATVNGQIVVKAPDWFYVDSALPANGIRRSYTPQVEGNSPTLVMEFVSATSESEYSDEYSAKRSHPMGKWFFYEQILQVPYYLIFEHEAGLLACYQLHNGRYVLTDPNSEGRYWIPEMQLFLGVWQGSKSGLTGYWLRWWDASGTILPWAIEQMEQERQRADEERQQKERLIMYLRSQGIDPDNLPSSW